MENWQGKLIPEQPGAGGVTDEREAAALAQAEEVARRTSELLITQGWCLWKCSTLGGDVVVVVRDESVKGIPEGYPIYTELELGELCQDGVSEATLKLVHETKKMAGAKVTNKATNSEGGS